MTRSRRARCRVTVFGALLIAVTLGARPSPAQTSSPVLLAVIRGDTMGPILAFIDPAAGAIVAKVPVGVDPHVAAISTDGKVAYVVNTNDAAKTPDADSLSVIDLVGRKEVRRVPTGDGSEPHDIHLAGGKLYFVLEGFRSVARYDPARNRIDWTIGLGQKGPHMLAVAPDLNTIVASNPDAGNLSIVTGVARGPSGWDISVLPVGKEPEGIEISPDGREAWVMDASTGRAYIVDIAKKAIIQTIDLKTTHANRLHFTADGRRVVIVDRHAAELLVIDVAGRALIARIPIPDTVTVTARNRNRVYDVVVTPDGSRAYVSANGPAGRAFIAIVDMNTHALTGRIETGAMADGMAWVVMK